MFWRSACKPVQQSPAVVLVHGRCAMQTDQRAYARRRRDSDAGDCAKARGGLIHAGPWRRTSESGDVPSGARKGKGAGWITRLDLAPAGPTVDRADSGRMRKCSLSRCAEKHRLSAVSRQSWIYSKQQRRETPNSCECASHKSRKSAGETASNWCLKPNETSADDHCR